MGTGTAIFLIIVFVLCVFFLLPIRVKFQLCDGTWDLTVKYLWIRILHKASQAPPEPELPPKPDPQGDTPSAAPQPQDSAHAEAAEESAKTEPKPEASPEKQPDQKQKKAAEAKSERKKKKKKKTEDAAAETEKPPRRKGFFKRLKPHGIKEILATVKDALAALSPSLRFLFRHFHFRHIKLYLAVGSDDPASTAQLYGKICAAGYPLYAALQSLLDIQTDELRILADFFNESMTVRTSLELRVSPAALILTVLILGIKFLWRAWLRFRREDREEKRIETETKPLPQNQAA